MNILELRIPKKPDDEFIEDFDYGLVTVQSKDFMSWLGSVTEDGAALIYYKFGPNTTIETVKEKVDVIRNRSYPDATYKIVNKAPMFTPYEVKN